METLGEKSKVGSRASANADLKEELRRFYNEVYQPLVLHVKPSLANLSQMITYLAKQVVTCFNNNLKERFLQHFSRFIGITTQEVLTRTYNEKKVRNQHRFAFLRKLCNLEFDQTEDILDAWKAQHLHRILPNNIEVSIYYDLEVQPQAYLPGMLYMNGILEGMDRRLFQPIPLRTDNIPGSIVLDTQLLSALFPIEIHDAQGNVPPKSTLINNITVYQEAIWAEFLRMNHGVFRKRKNTYKFDCMIRTDGISCSIYGYYFYRISWFTKFRFKLFFFGFR